MSLPVVAIVGRPNVGKSTLINRFVGGREAIVHGEEGVTRDRLYLKTDWNGRDFLVVDTGGIVPGTSDELLKSVADQARLAIEEADEVLFMVDADAGPTAADRDIATLLRKSRKPVILAVNKCDSIKDDPKAYEFYELGLGDPLPVSGLHGTGTGDLLDVIVSYLPPAPPPAEGEDDTLRVAIIGRPNVGKSSITNRLLGSERMIVSPMAGTTRDAIDSVITRDGRQITLVDTAGLRKKAKVDYGVEQFSAVRALKAMERADVVVLVIDATEGVTDQDKRLAGIAEEGGKALVLVVNKWDLVPKDTYTLPKFKELVLSELHHVAFAPVVFTSALTGQRVDNVLPTAMAAAEENNRRVTTGVVNEVVTEALALNPPPMRHGKRLRVYYSQQGPVKPPTFVLFCNSPELVTPSYERYLENKFREAFGFAGTPIRLWFRARREKSS
ncbi:MAG: ribosome biogenesis GTPase Der [Candidatus Sericytochromatia bacterium]|nr:ribosome biogenesis GTPase Der [Candidatus Tanganyikabacteria bacterium]